VGRKLIGLEKGARRKIYLGKSLSHSSLLLGKSMGNLCDLGGEEIGVSRYCSSRVLGWC